MLVVVGMGISKYDNNILTRYFENVKIWKVRAICNNNNHIIGLAINNTMKIIDVLNFRPDTTLQDLANELDIKDFFI